MPSVLLAGATGLVGRECLRLLAEDPAFERVVVIARRGLPPEIVPSAGAAKVDARIVDFDRLEETADAFDVDVVICALGTTMKQAGSRERFRRVDHDYPLMIARLAAEHGARHFLLVTALGASARSRVFYNRVKGEIEEAVSALPFRGVTIVRPSLLVGERAEVRRGEVIGSRLAFLLPRRYKPVRAAAVAATLVRAAKEETEGRRVIESAEIGTGR